jgi:hypothetical protein
MIPMYPTHLMEFLALSEHPFDPLESFQMLPGELTDIDSPAVLVVEQIRPRGTWVLVQTPDGLKRCLRPSMHSMFRDTLRRRLPDDTHATRSRY